MNGKADSVDSPETAHFSDVSDFTEDKSRQFQIYKNCFFHPFNRLGFLSFPVGFSKNTIRKE